MRWFKAACYILIASALVHSLSFLTPAPAPVDATEATLQDLVAHYKKDMMGAQQSLGDIVHGFLISFSILPFPMAATGLIVARGSERATVGRIAATYAAGLLVMTGVSIVWWFLAPTAFLATVTVGVGAAWLKIA